MTSRSRYFLIILGTIAFIILAPIIVLFVLGIKYDFGSHKFVRTGIITVTTQPKGAEIFLNGKDYGPTPTTIRFLAAGGYDVKISKPGYFDWNKRLEVRSTYVTTINQDTRNLVLYFANSQSQKIADQVQNFYLGASKILYLDNNKLYFANNSSPTETQSLSLNSSLNNFKIIASRNENYYLIYSANKYFVFDASKLQLTDISKFIPSGSKDFGISDAGNIYAINKNNLIEINLSDPDTIITLYSNILNYFIQSDSGIYALQKDLINKNFSIIHFYDHSQAQTLLTNVPNWNNAEIKLNSQNQIFIIGDGSLYTYTDQWNRIADYVNDIKFYDQYGKVLVYGDHEIDIYDTFDASTTLITRSSQQLADPVADIGSGYVFFNAGGAIQNIEIDNRDHQNNYKFAAVSANSKFELANDNINIFFLNAGVLQKLQVR